MYGLQTLVVGNIDTNCYILHDSKTKDAAVIDPGGEAAQIAGLLQRDGVTLRWLILTHGHFDHMLALPALRIRYPEAITIIHEADAETLTNPASAYVSPARRKDFVKPADRTAADGDRLLLGGMTLLWLHTPGHSPGSSCLCCEDLLFTGDTLFAGDCGRDDLPGGDANALRRSLRRLGQLEGDRRVLPGHGEDSSLTRERIENPYLRAVL